MDFCIFREEKNYLQAVTPEKCCCGFLHFERSRIFLKRQQWKNVDVDFCIFEQEQKEDKLFRSGNTGKMLMWISAF